jgi:hypothetical protein
MALIYFTFLVFERVLETYWGSFQRIAPEPTIIILEEERPEPAAIAA